MNRIVYWGATGLLAFIYLGGGVFYLTSHATVAELYGTLGYPAHLVIPLAIAKLAGAAAILVRRPVWLSDLAYAGMFFHLLLALMAHIAANDGGFLPAIVALILLGVSFFTQNAVRRPASPYAGNRLGQPLTQKVL